MEIRKRCSNKGKYRKVKLNLQKNLPKKQKGNQFHSVLNEDKKICDKKEKHGKVKM